MARKTIVFLMLPFTLALQINAASVSKSGISSGSSFGNQGSVQHVSIGQPAAKGNGIVIGVAAWFRNRISGKSSSSTISVSGVSKPMAALSEDFALGEIYAYPNPAKGGKVPVLHVEVGVADSVKITIYSVAGRAVHAVTLSGAPRVVTVSGVSRYAYEYSWNGHIDSGIYYFTMEAQKNGKKLRGTGKLAVVR